MSSYVVGDKQACIVLSGKVTNFIHDQPPNLYLLIPPHWGFYSNLWVWEDRNIWTVVILEKK